MSDDIKEEKKLVKLSIKGDKKSLEKLIEKYIDFCYSMSILFLEDDKLAKKALENTLMQVYNSIGDLYDPKGFRVWMYDILKTSISKLKSKGKVVEASSMDLNEDELKAKINYLTLNEIEDESVGNSEKLLRMLRKLPDEQKEIVALVDFEGLSCGDVAVLLDLEVDDVRQILYSSKSKLKEIFFPAQNRKVRESIKQPIITEPIFEQIPPMIKPQEPAIEDILWGITKDTKSNFNSEKIITNTGNIDSNNTNDILNSENEEIDPLLGFLELEKELKSYKGLSDLTNNLVDKENKVFNTNEIKNIDSEEDKKTVPNSIEQLNNTEIKISKKIVTKEEEPQIVLHNFDDDKNDFFDLEKGF
jgi:RNA polymerase sigma-70 factor (ECF subfamily)